MIIFVFTGWKGRTHAELAEWPEVTTSTRVWSYARLFGKARLPIATYVFGDFDRLSPWELELAARIFRILRAAGAAVLNDPARALQRYALLRKLKAMGKNSFNVWLWETDGAPDRYPVFLRTASAHRGAMSDLLHDAAAVRRAVNEMVEKGIPQREIMAVEFAAEPIGDVYRKYSVHCVGEQAMTSVSTHDRHWMIKRGVNGVAGERLYREERVLVEENRFANEIRDIFRLAHIDYGRADFGLVDGRIQVYEINTNPSMRRVKEHPSEDRKFADLLFRERFGQALRQIERIETGDVAIDDPILRRQREKDAKVLRDRYVA